MIDIGNDAGVFRQKYQLICPKCGKPAIRRENGPRGTAYLHLTKHGSVRHFIRGKAADKAPHPSAVPTPSPQRAAEKRGKG